MTAAPSHAPVVPLPRKRAVSYSEARSLECWRRHHFQYAMGLRRRGAGMALRIGSAVDEFWNTWFAPSTRRDDRVFDHALATATARFDRDAADWIAFHDARGTVFHDNPADIIAAERSVLVGMLWHYYERWGAEPGVEALHTQLAFDIPLRAPSGRGSTRYQARGVVDGVIRDEQGVWLVERKTTGRIDAAYREAWERNRQTRWYAWALRELGVRVDGVMIDVAARAVPVVPQLVKKGDRFASIVRADGALAVATTASVLRREIVTNGFDPADYQRELAVLDADQERWHWRHRMHLTDAEIDEAGREWLAVSKLVDQLPPVAMPGRVCSSCDFRDICTEPAPDVIRALYTTPDERATRRAHDSTTTRAAASADCPF